MRKDQDVSRRIYDGALISIGQFRRGPQHPNFAGPHWIGGMLLVFPRTSVTITHAGKEPVVADPNTVMFYNHGQVYSRGQLSEQGDACEWFGFASRLVADAIRPFDAQVDDRPEKPFQFSHGPSDTLSYLMQKLVADHVLGNQQPDHLFIEETVLCVLKQVIGYSYHQRGLPPQKTKIVHEREIVEALRKTLALHFEQNLSLEQIAAYLNYSPYHLCRIFHKHTGRSIHQYLKELRLRTALEYVTQANNDLTHLALKIGFSSHSHFTEAFRKTFGIPPSALRHASRQHLRELQSKISIA